MGKKVLFVDDDPHWRELAAIGLGGAGYDVLVAQDASEALQRAEGAELGLIILDLNLAGENGLHLMKYLRHNYPDVPILIYTSMDHDEAGIRSMMAEGADQYLPKGTIEELLVTLGGYYRSFS